MWYVVLSFVGVEWHPVGLLGLHTYSNGKLETIALIAYLWDAHTGLTCIFNTMFSATSHVGGLSRA